MAKGLVGSVGQGEATIFGGTTNPISVYMQTAAARQRQKAQEQQAQQKQVDDLLDYNEKFRPETKFADLNYTLANAAKEVSDVTRMRLKETNNPSLAMAESQNMQREVFALSKEMDGWKADIDNLDKTVGDLQAKGILRPEAKQAVRYGWRNPDGSIKSIPEIRQWANKMGETLNDPTIYDPKGTAKNWVAGLKDQSTHLNYKLKGAVGYNDDDVETTIKSKLKYKTDATGLVLDEEGNPIPEINDFTLSLAMQDPYMRTVISANGGPNAETRKQYLQSLVEPGADIADFGDRQITRGQKKAEPEGNSRFSIAIGSGGSKYADNALDVFDRVEAAIKPGANKPENLSSISDAYRGVSIFYSNDKGEKATDGKSAKYVTAMVPDKNKISQQMTLIMAVPPADPSNEESVKQRQEAIKQIINDNPTTFEKVVVDRNDKTALSDLHSRVADIYSALDVGSTDKRGLFRSDYHKILEKKYNVKAPKLPQGKVR